MIRVYAELRRRTVYLKLEDGTGEPVIAAYIGVPRKQRGEVDPAAFIGYAIDKIRGYIEDGTINETNWRDVRAHSLGQRPTALITIKGAAI